MKQTEKREFQSCTQISAISWFSPQIPVIIRAWPVLNLSLLHWWQGSSYLRLLELAPWMGISRKLELGVDQGLNPGTLILNVHIPRGMLFTMPNAHPWGDSFSFIHLLCSLFNSHLVFYNYIVYKVYNMML